MKSAIVEIVGISRYSQGRAYQRDVQKKHKENSEDYEERTWKERVHAKPDGKVFIPGIALSNCIKEAAKFLSIQVPGKGKATYTKHFDAGINIFDDVELDVLKDDVEGEWLFVPGDGQQGGGKRVWKCFPFIEVGKWGGEFLITITDDAITEDVLRTVLLAAGNQIGIGRWRPRNRGQYGRFEVKSLKFLDTEETMAAMAV